MEKSLVSLDVLEGAFGKIFTHLRDCGVSQIELKGDYYWDIATPEFRYDPYKDKEALSTELVLGQLFDDLQSVIELSETSVTGSHLIPLSALLRYIGEQHRG